MTYSTNYQLLAQQLQALISDETDIIANMANMSALLADALPAINWVGFYRVNEHELVLGPFQGKVACIRIPIGKGVCGTAVSEGKTMRIDDVHQFSGHIACDAASNSEIVIPIRVNNSIIAVLDIDSPEFSRFSEQDQHGLETLVHLFEQRLS